MTTPTYERKWWAKQGKTTIGPFNERDTALAEFKRLKPFKGPKWQAALKKHSIMTGYGEFGPHFDIRWHNPT